MQRDRFSNIVRAVVPRVVRNWIRSPSRSAQWLWDGACFGLGFTRTLQLSPQWSLICHPYAYKVAYQSQIADPEQAEEFHSFQLHCSREMVLFDIGAHFGIFSLAAAHFGGSAVAVDASPTAIRMAATQARLNRCSDRVRTLCAAVNNE